MGQVVSSSYLFAEPTNAAEPPIDLEESEPEPPPPEPSTGATLSLPIVVDDDVPIPVRATANAAGYDLTSVEDVTLPPQSAYVPVKTGIRLAMDAPHVVANLARYTTLFAAVRGRSGLAKVGIEAFDGTIDSDYHGEITILLRNVGEKHFSIERGDRIGQLVFLIAVVPNLAVVEKIDVESARGDGGFGSTGK